MSVLDTIRERLDGLTPKQRSIARYLLEAPDEASYLSLKELSVRTHASEVSILRLCRALGFESFVELKEALRAHTLEAYRVAAQLPLFVQSGVRGEGTPEQKLSQVCVDEQNNLSGMIGQLPAGLLFQCARDLLKADEVVIFAHDRSYLFADYLCYRLNFLRIKASAVQLGNGESVSTTLSHLKKSDYVILFSFPPYYPPTLNVARYCRYRGTPIIAVTDSRESPAAIEGSSVFLCPSGARYFYNSQVATVAFLNVLTASIAIEMAGRFDQILESEQDVKDFLHNGLDSGETQEHEE